jgi:hypothetical protein
VRDELLLLLAGFLLTSVIGGFLGYWLQRRAWGEQERARSAQAEREAATSFFEDLSRLFDRRLHRMRELDGWLGRAGETADVERSLTRYRAAVDDWNDNLNRMLSLARRYFGQGLRDYLDYDLGRRFVTVGVRLEARVREYRKDGEAASPSPESELEDLGRDVYLLNVALIEAIQRGTVGLFRPEVDADVEVAKPASQVPRDRGGAE